MKDCALICKRKLKNGTYLFTEPFHHILNVTNEHKYVYFKPNKNIHYQIYFFIDLANNKPERINNDIKVFPKYLKCKRLNCKSNSRKMGFFQKIIFCEKCYETICSYETKCRPITNKRKKRKDKNKPDRLRNRCIHVKCGSP